MLLSPTDITLTRSEFLNETPGWLTIHIGLCQQVSRILEWSIFLSPCNATSAHLCMRDLGDCEHPAQQVSRQNEVVVLLGIRWAKPDFNLHFKCILSFQNGPFPTPMLYQRAHGSWDHRARTSAQDCRTPGLTVHTAAAICWAVLLKSHPSWVAMWGMRH